jgi:hypothetical protein
VNIERRYEVVTGRYLAAPDEHFLHHQAGIRGCPKYPKLSDFQPLLQPTCFYRLPTGSAAAAHKPYDYDSDCDSPSPLSAHRPPARLFVTLKKRGD